MLSPTFRRYVKDQVKQSTRKQHMTGFASSSVSEPSFTAYSSILMILGDSVLHLLLETEDGSITLIRNVGAFLPEYTASHPRRQYSSQTSLRSCEAEQVSSRPTIPNILLS
jgi:hypothetical protein